MKLHCPDCGSPVSAEDMDLGKALAKCQACDSRFSFADSAGHGAASLPPPMSAGGARDKAGLLPRPEGLRLEKAGHAGSASWRWFEWYHLFLVIFCIVWDGFLVFWYRMAFSFGPDGNGPPKPFSLIMVLFPIGHVAVGIGLTYSVLAGLLNRTTVEASRRELVVRHRPIPWRGNRRLAASDVEQLYVERGHPARTGRGGVGHLGLFQLSAVLRDGGKVKLLGGFTSADKPLFLEQWIEQRLGIPPRPVVGEYRP